MMINATLLVQIINFIAAYYVLRFFFLKPVTHVIQKEDADVKKYHEAIKEKKDKIAQQVQIKREEWQACQHHFKENLPPILDRYVRAKASVAVILHEVPHADSEKMREEIARRIVAKVNHVS